MPCADALRSKDTVRCTKVDLKAAKDYIRECTYGKLGTRSPTRRSGDKEAHRQAILQWDASRERGMVRRSDRYLADQYLRRERREGRAHAHLARGVRPAGHNDCLGTTLRRGA